MDNGVFSSYSTSPRLPCVRYQPFAHKLSSSRHVLTLDLIKKGTDFLADFRFDNTCFGWNVSLNSDQSNFNLDSISATYVDDDHYDFIPL